MSANLTRASVTFHTNDEDKDADTRVDISVETINGTVVASLSNQLGHFHDHSDAGPFDLTLMGAAVDRFALKTGHVSIKIKPNGDDTWRFNFLLDLLFEDGVHQIARANRIELNEAASLLRVGIE